jgi:hypothetical protein
MRNDQYEVEIPRTRRAGSLLYGAIGLSVSHYHVFKVPRCDVCYSKHLREKCGRWSIGEY